MTQRARVEEFKSAAQILRTLPARQLVVPDNHDARFIAYERASTARQGASGLGLEATLRDSGVRLLAVDMPEANDLTVGIMALVAQAEREAISRRTKEALAVARARSVKLGNPNGAEALRRAGKGGVALRAAVVRNADQHATDLSEVIADVRAASGGCRT